MNVKDIRRTNMRSLSRSVGGVTNMAKKLGKSQSQISQLIGTSPTKNIGDKIAAEVEVAFDKLSGWLDMLHIGISEPGVNYKNGSQNALQQLIPLVTWEQARLFTDSHASNIPEHYQRVIAVTSDVSMRSFALQVEGDSMDRASGASFPEGCIIIIDPDVEIYTGAFVLSQLPDTDKLTFKQYAIDGGRNFLKPLNKWHT